MENKKEKIKVHSGAVTGSAAEAFTEMYEQHLSKVFRYISYRVRDNRMAEDLTSTVFEKALAKFNSYRSDKASVTTWLFSIARNTVIDHCRMYGNRQMIALAEADTMESNQISPEDRTIMEEEKERLQLCLAKLSDQEQEIISLKFGAELTNRRIAETMKLSESNVGTILYRAVRKLRDDFRDW